jgi:Amt family ammonium transporter
VFIGWLGFNPGSALAILGNGRDAALAAVNTTLSAASSTWSNLSFLMVLEYVATGQVVWDLIGTANSTLAGHVAITAGCSVVEVSADIYFAGACSYFWCENFGHGGNVNTAF